MQRRFGVQPGVEPQRRPLDLDVYVDSSGSMPDPRSQLSWPALAGAVICLSALRAGASVQVTLWASRTEVTSTKGFVRSADDCLRVLTGYYGGGTQFPLPTLRDTHATRVKLKKPTHILVVSDDGALTAKVATKAKLSDFDAGPKPRRSGRRPRPRPGSAVSEGGRTLSVRC